MSIARVLIGFLGLIFVGLIFQNCADYSNSPNSNDLYYGSVEINTTAATSFRVSIDKSTVSSGEEIDIEAIAEDEDGNLIEEFQYNSILEVESLTYASSMNFDPAPVFEPKICFTPIRFIEGRLKIKAKIINNNKFDMNLKVKIGGAGVFSERTIRVEMISLPNPPAPISISQLPSPRIMSAMIFDSFKRRILLYGGREILKNRDGGLYLQDGEYLAEFWELKVDETNPAWRLISGSAEPGRRAGHLMVLDRFRNRILLFGGKSEQGPVTDLWAFDPTQESWKKLNPAYPPIEPPGMTYGYYDLGKRMFVSNAGSYRSGSSEDGNWIFQEGSIFQYPIPSFNYQYTGPGVINDNVDVIYTADDVRYFNRMYKNNSLVSRIAECGGAVNDPKNCYLGLSSVVSAYDKQKAQLWMYGSRAEMGHISNPTADPYISAPVSKMYKADVRKELTCD